jgi:integrase
MRLATIVDEIARECDLEKSTVQQYRRSVKKFSEFLGRIAKDSDLTPAKLNDFVADLQKNRENITAGNYRRAMCRVWNYLTETRGKAAYEIKRLRRPKNDDRPVVAWSLDDVTALARAAAQLQGDLRIGVPGSAYFAAWIWTAYDTGLRPSDLMRIRWDQVDFANKAIVLTQHKTGKPHVVFLSDHTVNLIRAIRWPERDVIFPLKWGGLRKWTDKLYPLAHHFGFERRSGQSLGTIRKTHATETYRERGEAAAAEALGHVGGVRTVRKHYIDSRARRSYVLPRRPNGERTD